MRVIMMMLSMRCGAGRGRGSDGRRSRCGAADWTDGDRGADDVRICNCIHTNTNRLHSRTHWGP